MRRILFIFLAVLPFHLAAQWYPVTVPTTQGLQNIVFTDAMHGFIPVGDGTVLKSTDGGLNWYSYTTATTDVLADICFPTFSTGYICGNTGVVLKTTDAGNSWVLLPPPTASVLRGVYFGSVDTGFVCGQGQHIFRTTNGGTSWTQQTTGAYWLRQFSFPTPQTGFCAGDGLTIYKTTNGGVSWSQITGGGGTNLNDIQFLTVDTGYVCGLTGYAAKSTDGGATWQVLPTGTTTNFEGLFFFNTQKGYCVGSNGLIMKTTDGGATWITEVSGTTNLLRRITFISPVKGFTSGASGTLLTQGPCLDDPGPVTGPDTVCQGESDLVYAVDTVLGATGYTWSLPPGAYITAGANTHIITVTYSTSSLSGNVSVIAHNSYCTTQSSPLLAVTVNPLPGPTGAISGPITVCAGDQNVGYSVAPVTFGTGYSWTVPPGATFTGNGNTFITVDYPAGAVSGFIVVRGTNSCGQGDSSFIPVTVNNAVTPVLTGPDTVCQNGAATFSTQPGMTGYTWTYSPGTTILSGGTSTENQVTVSWGTPGGGWVNVNFTNPAGCSVVQPTLQNVVVIPTATPSVTISASDDTVCAGTMVTFTAFPVNPGMVPHYQWKVNGADAGSNSLVYSYVPANGDGVSFLLTSSVSCPSVNPVASNMLTETVNPNLPVSVTVTASLNPVCSGSMVTFTAMPVNGGSLPAFLWKVNGVAVPSAGSTFSYIPSNGDIVTCTLTSSEACTLNSSATSSPVTMTVDTNLPVSISIGASVNPVCLGLPVTFTASTVNGGSVPLYQWIVNGSGAGPNGPVYTYSPASGDAVWCILTSNSPCTLNNPATSNIVAMATKPVPVVTFSPCFDTITTTTAKPIKLKGGIPAGGTYSGPGVNPATGIWNPASAGTGVKQLVYTYTNAFLCTDVRYSMIDVRSPAAFACGNNLTDIRDNQSYQTVQIGSQCWMAVNLNYGTLIPSNTHQRDNCIPEKYCYNDLSTNCGVQSYYQWDELMRFDNTPGVQGLCPPGWHVPDEPEWNTLFLYFNGAAFAASPLLASGFSGFNAGVSGSRFHAMEWDYPGFAGHYWTSLANGPYKAWSHALNNIPDDHSVSSYPAARSDAYAVRCLKD
jgi:uncharacterized protein (TIGR02145 family)